MEIALSAPSASPTDPSWPDEAALAAFRAWLHGVPSRAAVDRYLPDRRVAGASARSVIGRVKRQLAAFATSRAQADLAATLDGGQPIRSETRQGRRCRHRDAARDAAASAPHRRRHRALASRAARGCPARGEHPHAGRPDAAGAETPTLVGRHRGARTGRRPPHRGLLRPASRADRTRSLVGDREPGPGTRPLGASGRP